MQITSALLRTSPAVYNALVQAKTALENSTLDTTLMELICASAINGCAFVWMVQQKHCANPARAMHKLTPWSRWRKPSL